MNFYVDTSVFAVYCGSHILPYLLDLSSSLPGKAGEAALQEKLDKIRGDYLALVERVKTENVKAASDLEKKFLKDEEDFKKKQVNFFLGGEGGILCLT